MARKRIEDLLREEARKSSNSEDNAAPEAESQTLEIEAVGVSEDEPQVLEIGADASHASAVRRTTTTKAELETLVQELKAALQASETENSSLQQKIAVLQSDLQDQKTLKQKLQVELEQAKKVILQLSESNSTPQPFNGASIEDKSRKSQSAPQPLNNASPENTSKKSDSALITKTHRFSDYAIKLDSKVVENPQPDVGWFD